MNSRSALTQLLQHKPAIGLIQTIPTPALTELAVWSGFDFVILDCEHGVVDEPAQLACLQIIAGSPAFAAVRVRPGNLSAVGRYLDFGADAILMPDVQTPVEAAALVAAATLGPRGTRSSTGSARAYRYGLSSPSREPPLLLALIESKCAVDNVAEIVATPGLGGVVIGPSDLSADLECANNFSAPAYRSAFAEVEKAATAANVLLGTKPHPGYPLERLLAAGHRFIIAVADINVLREGFRSQLKSARAVAASTCAA